MLGNSIVWRACVLALMLACWAEMSQAKAVALLIGVGDYNNAQLDIPGVDKDLAKAERMMRRFGVQDDAMVRLYNSDATVQNVEAQFQRLAGELRREDHFYLYFSTHGLQLTDTNGDELDGRDEALALSDFRIGKQGHLAEVSGVLVDDRLAELLAALPTRRTVIIADTCHSGSISKSLDDVLSRVGKFIQMPHWLSGEAQPVMDEALKELSQPGVVMLSAAADGELADIDENGSVFTRALMDTQIDPEQDNAWCWFQRARAQVRSHTGGVQWPQFSGAFAQAVEPLQGQQSLMQGVALMQNCSADAGFSARLEGSGSRRHLSAQSHEPGWVTAISVYSDAEALRLKPLASRWHHGRDRQASLSRVGNDKNANSGAWVLWTADGVELPRHRGDFSVLWKSLQTLSDGQWASDFVAGVDLDAP